MPIRRIMLWQIVCPYICPPKDALFQINISQKLQQWTWISRSLNAKTSKSHLAPQFQHLRATWNLVPVRTLTWIPARYPLNLQRPCWMATNVFALPAWGYECIMLCFALHLFPDDAVELTCTDVIQPPISLQENFHSESTVLFLQTINLLTR